MTDQATINQTWAGLIQPQLPQRTDWRIGCIGAGFIMDECHLVAYGAAGITPQAIASRTKSRAQQVADRHGIATVYEHYEKLLSDEQIEVIDIAVPPDLQFEVIEAACREANHIRGILAQKPLGVDFRQAREIVRLCNDAGITLAVNQNMRYDQSVRACRHLIEQGELGTPVLATIDMRGDSALDALARTARLGHVADHEHSSSRYVSLLVW